MNKTVVPTLELRNVVKTFKQGEQKLDVLKGVNLEIMPGEIVALLGPSGSGKSTMLQIAGLLDRPTKGEIYLDGQSAASLATGCVRPCGATIWDLFINTIICWQILTQRKM